MLKYFSNTILNKLLIYIYINIYINIHIHIYHVLLSIQVVYYSTKKMFKLTYSKLSEISEYYSKVYAQSFLFKGKRDNGSCTN